MTELNSSSRAFFRATYTPIDPVRSLIPGAVGAVGAGGAGGAVGAGGADVGAGGAVGYRPKRAVQKYGIMTNLDIDADEVDRLAKYSGLEGPEIRRALSIIEATIKDSLQTPLLERISLYQDVEWNTLIQIIKALGDIRQKDLVFDELYGTLLEEYQLAQERGKERLTDSQEVQQRKSLNREDLTHSTTYNDTASSDQSRIVPLKPLLEWAKKNNIQREHVSRALNHIDTHFNGSMLLTNADYKRWSMMRIKQTSELLYAAKQTSVTEPVGYLHLERLNFIPAGIEPGELVYSVPLSPAEEVNISHKEWSHTSEEFSRIVTDFFEAYSEEGVAEKSEIAQSTSSQQQHSDGFNTGVTASGGYGPVSITASVGYNTSSSSSESQQSSLNQSVSITRKASARSRKEHKISFKVASAAGTEDQQVRKIKNPFPDKAIRVDYYQLVRKWRVNLYRYGLRLTYDLAIPEPGIDLLSKLEEIKTIRANLEREFAFDLDPTKIQADTYKDYEKEYGVSVELPPDMNKEDRQVYVDYRSYTADEAVWPEWRVLGLTVPEEYEVQKTYESAIDPVHHPDLPDALDIWGRVEPSTNEYANLDKAFVGKSGKFTVVIKIRGLERFEYVWKLYSKYRYEVFEKWQHTTWNTFLEAARTKYQERRKSLQDHLSRLLEEVGSQDPLSLRKIEREEVMKHVLRWLFGPDFGGYLSPAAKAAAAAAAGNAAGAAAAAAAGAAASAAAGLEAADLDGYLRKKIMERGEIIKFLHQAIEWENMVYFLYPYFWTNPYRWPEKLDLDHPDFMHRTFLKAGSARVVLPIRPGFERIFVNFVETGKLEDVNDAPYLSIADEMRAFANTNYPGIQAANPVENFRPLLYPKQQKAWKDMQDISKLLQRYSEKNGNKYPSTAQGLIALQPYTAGNPGGISDIPEVPLMDPWDHNYVYVSPGEHGDYDLLSYGADGLPDPQPTFDENGDITSWAESSLIGTWFEHTPTSALDIRFAEEMPYA